MMTLIESWAVHVLGTPATKGSWKIRRRRGKAWLQADNERERPWAENVAWHAKQAWGSRPLVSAGVAVSIVFEMLKPARPVRPFPVGDVDKLARSCLDALTGIVWEDDVLVVELLVGKRYVARDPGAWIRLSPFRGESIVRPSEAA
jgi:crossover junction endodeoxyribonuclease RusA